MIYPIGHPVRWDKRSTPRIGAQTGVLSREWDRHNTFPWVLWDGEDSEQQCLPECVEPAPLSPAQLAATSTTPPAQSRAWYEYEPARRVRA